MHVCGLTGKQLYITQASSLTSHKMQACSNANVSLRCCCQLCCAPAVHLQEGGFLAVTVLRCIKTGAQRGQVLHELQGNRERWDNSIGDFEAEHVEVLLNASQHCCGRCFLSVIWLALGGICSSLGCMLRAQSFL